MKAVALDIATPGNKENSDTIDPDTMACAGKQAKNYIDQCLATPVSERSPILQDRRRVHLEYITLMASEKNENKVLRKLFEDYMDQTFLYSFLDATKRGTIFNQWIKKLSLIHI